jgi:hypothetical protein
MKQQFGADFLFVVWIQSLNHSGVNQWPSIVPLGARRLSRDFKAMN